MTTPPGAELYRAALDALQHPVALLDSQGTVVAANRLWSSSAGADPLAGATVGESVVARLQQAGQAGGEVLDPLRQVLSGGGPRIAHSYRSADGRPFRLTATPLAGGGAVLQRSEEDADAAARQPWEEDVRRQAFLAEATALLVSTFDPDTVLRTLARMAVPHIADCCLVDLVAEDRGSVRRVAFAHADPGAADIAWEGDPGAAGQAGAATRVIQTGEPVLYADVDENALEAIGGRPEQVEMLRGWGLRSAMVVPIVARGRTLGSHHPGRDPFRAALHAGGPRVRVHPRRARRPRGGQRAGAPGSAGSEPHEGRVPRHPVPRAAHAAQRHRGLGPRPARRAAGQGGGGARRGHHRPQRARADPAHLRHPRRLAHRHRQAAAERRPGGAAAGRWRRPWKRRARRRRRRRSASRPRSIPSRARSPATTIGCSRWSGTSSATRSSSRPRAGG